MTFVVLGGCAFAVHRSVERAPNTPNDGQPVCSTKAGDANRGLWAKYPWKVVCVCWCRFRCMWGGLEMLEMRPSVLRSVDACVRAMAGVQGPVRDPPSKQVAGV